MGLDQDLELLEEARAKGDRGAIMGLQFKIGQQLAKKGETEDALAAFQEAYNVSQVLDEQAARLDIIRRVTSLLVNAKRYEEAHPGLVAGLEMAEEQGNLSAKVDILTQVATMASGTGRPDKAVRALEEAADICRANKDDLGELLMMENLGPALRAAKRPESALVAYKRMNDLAVAAGDVSRQGLALVGVYQMSEALGEGETAVKYLHEAERLFRSAKINVWAEMVRKELDKIETPED